MSLPIYEFFVKRRNRRANKACDQLQRTGEIVEIDDRLHALWMNQRHAADIPDREDRANLHNPRFYPVIVQVREAKHLLKNEKDSDMRERIHEHLVMKMKKALEPIATEVQIERAGEETRRQYIEETKQHDHANARNRFLES